MAVLDKGSLIRNQMVLLFGDMIAMLLILLFWGMVEQKIPGWAYLCIPTLLFSSYICEVYNPKNEPIKTKAIHSGIAIILSFTALIIFTNASGFFWQLTAGSLLFFVIQIFWQSLYQKTDHSSIFKRNILVIGTGPTALKIEKMLEAAPGRYSLSGYLATPTDPRDVDTGKIVGHIDDIVSLCQQYDVHSIVIALTEKRGNLMIDKLVTCKLNGVRIIDYPNFYETMTGKIPVETINPSWLVQSRGFLITPFTRVMKRLIDIVCSSLLLILSLPFFPLFAFMAKSGSPGSVFYSQQRVGIHGENFTIYKLRTMSTDAEKNSGASWASEDDPRISRYGHFMRKTRIDELPQLFNVLKGDMSFIGPRPERPEFVKQINEVTPYYMERHAVKPGITGWAQVMFPYGSSLGDSVEKLRYDLYYINNLSLFLELIIVFETMKVVLFRRGSR